MSKSKSISKDTLLPPLWVLVALLLVGFVWLLVQLKEIVTMLVIGFSISYVIEPALAFLERHKVRRQLGVILVLGGFTVGLLLLFLTAIPTISREYSALIDNLPQNIETAKSVIASALVKIKSYIPADRVPIDQWLASPLATLASVGKTIFPKIGSTLVQALGKGYTVTMALVNLALLPFIVFYLSVDFPHIKDRFLSLIPQKSRKKVQGMTSEMNLYVSAFVRGQMLVCSILFIMYALGLAFIGVELWFLLAVIAGFGNMVPYLGFMVGIFLTSVMALVTFGSFSKLVAVWILFAVVQSLEGTFITPKILGDTVGLSPLTVILALIIGGSLFGLLGVFLAIPGAAIVKVLATHFHVWLLKRV